MENTTKNTKTNRQEIIDYKEDFHNVTTCHGWSYIYSRITAVSLQQINEIKRIAPFSFVISKFPGYIESMSENASGTLFPLVPGIVIL